MMKHLQKPAVQMILLLVVVGIAAVAYYMSKSQVQTANKPPQAKSGAPASASTPGMVPEEKTVALEGERLANRGSQQDVQKFAPPPKKPTPPTILPTTTASSKGKQQKAPPFPKLVHVSNTTPESFSPSEPRLFAPRGTLIKAALVITVDSSALDTPVLALVTEDVYWNKKLIVPAGTQVIAKAGSGRTRDRIEVKGNFVFIWADGREYNISGVALDHERLPDGSYGIPE